MLDDHRACAGDLDPVAGQCAVVVRIKRDGHLVLAKGKGADNGVSAKLVPNGGAEALKDLEKPPKIMGYIKQTIGSLGPQDMLVVKVLSLFAVDTQDEKPLPTLPVIARAYRSMAEITGGDLVEVLNRLAL